ncbi:MAG: zinc ribbon domain-containing protein [Saccharofermentans sp.]|nr:zinc ribbon domain-containing protein [Saccharofermentans sp.]
MGLIKCPDCGNMVSERAEACPSCGCPVSAFMPDFFQLTSDLLAFHLLKCADREDLIPANDCLLNDLRERLSTGFPVTFIGSGNFEEQLSNIADKRFSFPYVFVTANFRYIIDYMKFPLARKDGRIYQRYYDEDILPCNYAPVIEIFSDDPEQTDEIAEKLTAAFKEIKTYSVPFGGAENDSLQFTGEIGQISDAKLLIDSIETKLIRKTITLKQSQWACLRGKETSIKYNAMKPLRELQLAQFCLYFAAMKDECDRELELYDFIFNSTRTGVPYQSADYKTLKNLVISGQTFESDLVDKVFPKTSLIYHALPNDLLSRTHVSAIQEKVSGLLDSYESSWKTVCDSYDLPGELDVPDWDYSGLSNNMRSTDGLGYLIDSLVEDHTRKIKDIIEDYKELLAYEGQAGRIESDQRFDDFMDMLSERSERRRTFVKGVLQTAAGVALGNKISDKIKKKD